MADTQSEMSSEIEEMKKEVKELRSNLDWTSAILAVMLQEAGGAVEIAKADLGAIPLKDVMARITDQGDYFLVEGVFDEQS